MKKQKLTIDWVYAAVARAVKTVAQTALGMFTVGAAMSEIDWGYIMSVAAVSGIYSLLTSVATDLPETITDGELKVDTTDPHADKYLLDINQDLDGIRAKKYLRLKVNNQANLNSSQE